MVESRTPESLEVDSPDVGIAREVFIWGIWCLLFLALWQNWQRSGVKALQAQLETVRTQYAHGRVLNAVGTKPPELVWMSTPDRKNYAPDDDGKKDFDGATEKWDLEFGEDAWAKKKEVYADKIVVWQGRQLERTEHNDERKFRQQEETRYLKAAYARARSGLDSWSRFSLLIKSAGALLVFLGLVWIWLSASGREKSIAAAGLLVVAFVLALMALGNGNEDMSLDVLSRWGK